MSNNLDTLQQLKEKKNESVILHLPCEKCKWFNKRGLLRETHPSFKGFTVRSNRTDIKQLPLVSGYCHYHATTGNMPTLHCTMQIYPHEHIQWRVM